MKQEASVYIYIWDDKSYQIKMGIMIPEMIFNINFVVYLIFGCTLVMKNAYFIISTLKVICNIFGFTIF